LKKGKGIPIWTKGKRERKKNVPGTLLPKWDKKCGQRPSAFQTDGKKRKKGLLGFF